MNHRVGLLNKYYRTSRIVRDSRVILMSGWVKSAAVTVSHGCSPTEEHDFLNEQHQWMSLGLSGFVNQTDAGRCEFYFAIIPTGG